MKSLELATAPKQSLPKATLDTIPVRELQRLIADIRRSRAWLEKNEETLPGQDGTLDCVAGSDPRD